MMAVYHAFPPITEKVKEESHSCHCGSCNHDDSNLIAYQIPDPETLKSLANGILKKKEVTNDNSYN